MNDPVPMPPPDSGPWSGPLYRYLTGLVSALSRRLQRAEQTMPPGVIVRYNGSETPEGWLRCDGTNGTPDLREEGTYIMRSEQ